MATTESVPDDENDIIDKLSDWKIILGITLGAIFVLVTCIVVCYCTCCKRNKRRRKPQQPRQQQPQTFTVPMTVARGRDGETVVVINSGTLPQQTKGASLPDFNQQRPPQTAMQPRITEKHPRVSPSPRQGATNAYVARAQHPPQQAVQQQSTQGREPPPTTKNKKKEKKKKKEKQTETKTEFRMSGLENKPTIEANKYIHFEVPAPDSHDKSPQAAISNPDIDKMAKYITRSITKVLEAINIDPEKIKRQDILGSGQFGVVYKGEMIGEKSPKTEVAMKTVVGDSGNENGLQEFMDEVLRMKNFNHTNVMPMLGMTIMDDKPYMVLPYMENGDMKSFISKPTKVFTVEDLLRMALQVSRGMEYLSGQNIIHGDLAARNCMVGKDDTVKVADFGLSRHLFQSDYYSLNQSETLRPFRWMAVECLLFQKFSFKSDVWSFGILLWEIMTRGQKPYPDTPTNMEVMEKLKAKYRMPCPQYCAEEIYEVMTRSWDEDPANRPSFKDTTKMIELLLEQAGGDYERPVPS